MSPAYDLLSTIPYLPSDRLALGFGGSKDLHGVTRNQVRRLSGKAALTVDPLWRIVRETAERTVEAWRDHDVKRLLPDHVAAAIDRHIDEAAGRMQHA